MDQADIEQKYCLPPKAIKSIINAPPHPGFNLDPTGGYMLVMKRKGLPSIEDLVRPEARIWGIRIDKKTNGPSQRDFYTGLSLITLCNGKKEEIKGLPKEALIQSVHWSPDGITVTDKD